MADIPVIVGKGGSKHKLRRVLVGFGLVLIVAALALAAGAGARWLQQKREYSRLAKPENVTKEASAAQKQSFMGDYDKALTTINEALDNPSLSAQAKHDLYLQQGAAYENQKKYDEAMASYRKAESFKETLDAAQSIARMAEQKGDKALAITYYKKAITLIPDDDAMKDALKKYFENTIRVLEGKEPIYE